LGRLLGRPTVLCWGMWDDAKVLRNEEDRWEILYEIGAGDIV
jgi:hypothetical protein